MSYELCVSLLENDVFGIDEFDLLVRLSNGVSM